jgi:hypothetical protein
VDDRDAVAEPLGLVEVLPDAVAQLLELDGRLLDRPACLVHALPVERFPEPRLQILERIEPLQRPDRRRPGVDRELVAVLPVDIGPRSEGGALGIDEQAVEVEEQRADHRPSASSRPRP